MYKERTSTLAERLSFALKHKKIKQVDLCNRLNITKGAMCHYIKGDYEPRQDRIDDIARALNVNEAWLMGYDVPMERFDLQLFAENKSPSTEYDEGEQLMIELYRRASPEVRELVTSILTEVESYPEESRKMLLGMVRGAFEKQ